MESQGTEKNSKASRITVGTYFRIPLPCILIGGALGALIGGALGHDTNGIRAGIILGGIVAYIIMRRKQRRGAA
jgi:hypothetical protein